MTGILNNNSILDNIYLGKLPSHITVLLVAAITWQGLMSLSDAACTKFMPNTYCKLTKKRQVQWNIRIVSLIHAVGISALALMLWNDKVLSKDRLFSYTPFAGNVYAIACGYFLWDSVISWIHIKEYGPSFLVHGVSCLFVFLFSFGPFAMSYGSVFLFFELSTPFLNMHWMMEKAGMRNTKYQFVNGILLVSTFFFARILSGFYASFCFYRDIFSRWNDVPTFHKVLYGTSNVVLCTLNVIWMTKLLKGLIDASRKSSFGKIKDENTPTSPPCQREMSSIVSNIVKKETWPVLVIIAGAVGLAGGHLTKLALDPHTLPNKTHDSSRRWEQSPPSRYAVVRWRDVMKKQERN